MAAILFDLDGTLLDTLADITVSVNYVRGVRGHPPVEAEAVRRELGLGVRRLLKGLVPEGDEEARRRLVAEFRTHYAAHLTDATRPYPGIPDLLAFLAERRLPMAVVSNKPAAFTRSLVDHFGWSATFAVVLGGDSLEHAKPHPAPLLAAARGLEVPIDHCWMIGDSPTDMQAAAEAGCPVRLAVTWGYRDREALAASPATGLLETPAALPLMLGEAGLLAS